MAQSENRNALAYSALLLTVLFLALAGYAGYALYPRFDLPAVTGAGLLLLAAAAGLASFFSPCSFPLLATLLARQVRDVPRRQAWTRLLHFAAALAAGATLFLLSAGAVLALGAAPLLEQVTFTSTAGRLIRGGVGALLLLLGLLQWRGLVPGSSAVYAVARPFVQAQARLRRERPSLAFGLFGFSYILAGFG
jgi:cytochrome c biogenesis protein CcdA